jgi:DNA-binding SARP family transcriptional activator/TolB-like protein
VLRLYTFGSVHLGQGEIALSGAAAQRRLLALLAALSVGGRSGLTREKLLLLFWPDAGADKARHALNQALYNARRVLRLDDLFITSAADVRLNPECLTSDVRDFDDALDADDPERAVALYRGPFLDGFYISGSPDFEQWTSAERSRLAGRMADALERLATAAEARTDLRAAAEWRKRAVALNPLDSVATVRLMHALAAAGDLPGALQHARVHELLLREQFDVDPDPTVVLAAGRLRTEGAAASAVATAALADARIITPTSPAVAVAGEPNLGVARETPHGAVPTAGSPTATAAPAPTADGRSRHRGRRVLSTALAALAVTAVAVAAGRFALRQAAPFAAEATPVERRSVVVAPFRVTGADASLSFLHEGIVELLALRLADQRSAHVVDPGVVLAAWRSARLLDVTDIPRSSAVRVADRLGARVVVTGSVVGNAARLILTAAVVAVPDGQVRAQETVEGPADSLSTLVDALAVRLLAAEAGEGVRLTRGRPPSLAAWRAYLEGRRATARADYAEAMQQLERAVHADSTFAVAAFHLALVADRLNAAEQHDRALALAWAARDALSDQDEAHLLAFAGPRYPAPSPEAEQIAAWERAAALAPDRAEVWEELGERFYYQGDALTSVGSRERADQALHRALTLDPTSANARRLLILDAARTGDTAGLARFASTAALRDSVGELAPFVRWRAALARTEPRELRRLRDTLPHLSAPNLRSIAMASLFDGVGVDDGERALRILRLRAGRAADQADAILAQHAFALNQGRPVLALDLTEQLQELQPGTRAHLRLRVLDALYSEGDRPAAVRAVQELARYADGPAPSVAAEQALQLADMCVLEQWRLARGELGSTRRAIARLRTDRILRGTVPLGTTPLACADMLEAMVAVHSRAADALARVHTLDSLMLTGPAMSDATTYVHIAVARLYARLGYPDRALGAIRRRAYMTGWPRYQATARREEGQLALATADTAGARRALTSYLSLRSAAEPPVATVDGAARTLLQRIETGR